MTEVSGTNQARAPERVAVLGLPRSGTTWLAEILAAAPGVNYVHEPDNQRDHILAGAATRRLGPFPTLSPGERAVGYHLLWKLAFAGGWPPWRSLRVLRRRAHHLPASLRWRLEVAAAVVAARRRAAPPVMVKSVRAHLAAEWLAREFDPLIVVVWRHPLNLVPAWMDRGWDTAAPVAANPAVRGRFTDTDAWPPPERRGIAGVAWAACAQLTILLETAARHPEWLVVAHERQCVEPVAAFRGLFARTGLAAPTDLEDRLAAAEGDGTGFEVKRRAAQEPHRWRQRLPSGDAEDAQAVVERFMGVSEVAAAEWSQSPAVAS